jgi:gliding motility-associated-like protein
MYKYRLLILLLLCAPLAVFAEKIPAIAPIQVDTVYTFLDTSACKGTLLTINGVEIEPNSSAVFFYLTANGEDSILSVTVFEKLPVERQLDSSFCVGQTIEFANLTFMPAADTLLTGIFTGANGCDSVVSMQLTRRDPPESNMVLSACRGASVDVYGVTIAAGNTQIIQRPAANGCDTLLTIQVDIAPDLEVTLPETVQIMAGDSILLQPSASTALPVTWAWQPPTGLNCTTCEKPTAQPAFSMRYTATATDATGCKGSASVSVLVDDNCPVYAPNVIQLDLDGRNDWFTVYGADCIQQIGRLSIYDRWGGLLFEQRNIAPNDEQAGWDGRIRGRTAPPGVYLFVAEINLFDGRNKQLTGDFTIIR